MKRVADLKQLIQSTGLFRRYVVLMLFRAPFDGISTLVHAWFLREAYAAVEHNDEERLELVCLIFGIAVCIMFLYNGTIWRLFGTMYIRLGARLKRRIISRIIDKPLQEIEDHGNGDLLTRLNQDSNMAITMLGGALNLPHLVIASCNILLCSAILLGTNIPMLLLVWLFTIPHVILNRYVVAVPSATHQKEAQQATGELTTIFNAIITEAPTAILYDAQEMLYVKYRTACDRLYHARMRVCLHNCLQSILIPIFGLGGYMALILYAGRQITEGTMQFSDLTGILQLRAGILLAFMMVINCVVNSKVNVVGLERVNVVLQESIDNSSKQEGNDGAKL